MLLWGARNFRRDQPILCPLLFLVARKDTKANRECDEQNEGQEPSPGRVGCHDKEGRAEDLRGARSP